MAIRKINYHGTSKILLRLCEAVNSLIESGGSGGSKHTIINKNGTAMSDRAGLQFTGGATVTDDSVNDKTVVQIPSEASDISFDDSQCRIISNSDDVQKAIKSADNSLYIYGDSISNLILALGDKASDPTTFTEASTRTNIASGDYFDVILGKIKKYFSDLKAVAFSGSYTDLSDKPTIPAAQIQSDWNQSDNSKKDFIKNKPTIPDISTKVSKSGDTMSGSLQLGDSTARGELKIIGNDKTHYGRFYNTSGSPLSDNRNYNLPDKSGTIALTSDIPLEYYEFTTASGETKPSCVQTINTGFLSSGRVSISKINNQITVRVAGITTKSSIDWVCCMEYGYRPVLSADEYFTYCLGDEVYKGYVSTGGHIYFQTLDTTHILSATITFNNA